MSRNVTVGSDGSSESRATAEWAAHETKLRGLPLRLVHVWETPPGAHGADPAPGAPRRKRTGSERIPRETAEGLRPRHPGVHVDMEQIPGRPADALAVAAKGAEVLVAARAG